MIKKTRLKLALWYALIMVGISAIFSSVIYSYISFELERGYVRAQMQIEMQDVPFQPPRLHREEMQPQRQGLKNQFLFDDDLNEAKSLVLARIFFGNGLIIIVASALGYYLAGKSLEPIARAFQEQTRFISDASHQLRTPLTALKTSLEVNLNDKRVSKYSKKILQENLNSVNDLTQLSNKLLQLVKVPTYSQSKLIDPTKEVAKVISQFKSLLNKSEIKIKVTNMIGKSKIKIDPSDLREIASIILDNAIKFSSANTKILVRHRLVNNSYQLEISDQGRGIPNKDLPRVFSRFFQSESLSSNRRSQGSGIGLALAKKLVESHSGQISVSSKYGKGSIFTIKFPLG